MGDYAKGAMYTLQSFNQLKSGREKSNQLREQSRLSSMQETDLKAKTMEEQLIAQASNKAKAAASGIAPRKSRSFLALMDENERKYKRDIHSIKVMGNSKRKLYAMKGSAAKRSSVMNAGVSLIKGWYET